MKYLCICSNRSGSHFLEKALKLPAKQDNNFLQQNHNNFKKKEVGLFRFHSINHAKEKYDVFMDWTKTFIASADLIQVHIRANVFDMSLSQVVRKTIHSHTMNDVSLSKLTIDIKNLNNTYELNKSFMLQFGSDIEKETDSLYCHRKLGPLSKPRLWYNYNLIIRSIRWRNENEEASPPSLKRRLFLRPSAVKVPKRKCAGGITSAKTSLSKWKQQLVENAASLFASTDKQSSEAAERIAHLEQLVGRLTVALDIQKKASAWLS